MKRKEKKSKLRDLSYENLALRKYLVDVKTSFSQKIMTFKWRTRMAEGFGENYRGGSDTVMCPFSLSHPDSQDETYQNCSYIENIIKIDEEFTKLFDEIVPKKLIETITVISKMRGR